MYTFWRYLTAPLRFVAGIPRWFLSRSIPTRAALVVALLLVVLVVTAFLIPSPEGVSRWKDWQWWPVPVLLGTVLIPLSVWYLLSLWLQGAISGPSDIDDAWNAGLNALRRHGLDLRDIPIFLVLGHEDDAAARWLFQASGIEFAVENVPAEPAPLHWYANRTAIYLACTGTSCLSTLANVGNALAGRTAAQPMPTSSPRETIKATIVPGALPGGSEFSESGSFVPQPAADIRGTMEVPSTMDLGTVAPSEFALPERRVPKLSDDDVRNATSRLEYLCSLIRRAREPLCAINGVLTLLPYAVIQTGPGGGLVTAKAVREDLGTITRTLRLRYPVTAMVSGMHAEPGFRELVRRVGTRKAQSNRFGKGFGVVHPSSSSARPAVGQANQLGAVASHACGAFEDFVYALFAAQGGIYETGNRKLFSLLCKVRTQVQDRLANILASAYAMDGSRSATTDAPFFGGCYFGAAGSDGGSQAFVRSVLDKLLEQHEEVEWTGQALRGESRLRKLGYCLVVVDIVLALLIGAKLIDRIS